MDVHALQVAIAHIRGEIDQASTEDRTPSRNSPDNCADEQLRHELDTLGERLNPLQQWLHALDPQELARWRSSLGQVGFAVNVALEKTLQAVKQARGHNYDWLAQSLRSFGPHVTELRQCVALIDFTLKVLALPAGLQAQGQTEELRVAARTLYEAQGRSGEERSRILRKQQASTSSRSEGFQAFVRIVLEAESELRQGNTSTTIGQQAAFDRDELHLPLAGRARPGEALPSGSRARTRSRQSSYPSTPREVYPSQGSSASEEKPLPPRPPKEAMAKDPGPSLGMSQQQIRRRPVARASTSPVPRPTTPTTPISPQNSYRFVERHRSLTMFTPTRLRSRPGRRTGTRELFNQASMSLGNLTQEEEALQPSVEADLPPPYAENTTSAPAPPRDSKRPHADSVSSTVSQSMSTFALIQDNMLDGIHERVKQGRSINELDPLTKRTALMEAANLERTSIVSVMLKTSNQVHQKDLDGNSALHFAAVHGSRVICNDLLEAGATVEEYNRHGETPISLAARGGHADAVDCLLNYWSVQRGTAAALTKGYLEALRSGNVNTVSCFIERHIKPKKIKESVLCAAEGGSVPTLDFILAQKAVLKERSPDGWTALHFAAEQGHIAMVEKLLALGIPWKAQTKKVGENALAIAIRNRHIATANALILHKDAKVNREDNYNVTPLHHTVRIGDLGLMTTLLNAGAKLDVQSKYGWTIFQTAAAYGHTHLVAELITRGVSVEEKTSDPEISPEKKTNEGARRGYWAEIRWPHSGARPLHLALEFGHDEVANVLIAAGAKIDAPDGRGWRPLHYAAFSARPAIVELLLARGASPHATTDDNNTPLSLGFRAYGLDANEEEKIRVWELLQGAMNATKKSRLKRFADSMSGSSAGRQVERRNKIWHTAELAAALHLNEEGVQEEGVEEGSSRRSGSSGEVNEEEGGQGSSRTGFVADEKGSPR